MKATLVKRLLTKYLLPELSGFLNNQRYIYMAPAGSLLRAIIIDSTSIGAFHFYTKYFVQPLFVPRERVALSHGDLLRNVPTDYEQSKETEIMTKILQEVRKVVLPFFSRIQTPLDLAEYLLGEYKKRGGNRWGDTMNIHNIETIGFAYVLSQNFVEAKRYLDLHIEQAKSEPKWALERAKLTSQIRKLLDKDPSSAIALLNRWTAETKQHLKLPTE